MPSVSDIVQDYLAGEDYNIRAGETLSRIGERYGMTARQLWEFEGNTGTPNADRIAGAKPGSAKAGETIRIPKLPASIADAPATVDLPAEFTNVMDGLWKKSIAMRNKRILVAPNTDSDFNVIHMNQIALEHGGTVSWIIADAKPEVYRTGSGTAGTFSPNTSRDRERYILGTLHTHPYTRYTDGDDNADVAFSGGDVAYYIGTTALLDLVQSGETRFGAVRTKAAPRGWSNNANDDWTNEFTSHLNDSHRETFQEAAMKAAKKTCTDYGYAMYSGKNASLAKEN